MFPYRVHSPTGRIGPPRKRSRLLCPMDPDESVNPGYMGFEVNPGESLFGSISLGGVPLTSLQSQ